MKLANHLKTNGKYPGSAGKFRSLIEAFKTARRTKLRREKTFLGKAQKAISALILAVFR
jgi:hypothetical protein